LVAEAISYVADQEYWFWLQELHGRHIPLEYDCELVA